MTADPLVDRFLVHTGPRSRLEDVPTSLVALVEQRRIDVRYRELPSDTPAQFDGLSITLRLAHDPRELSFYLAHSLGSCAGWALDFPGVSAIFDELRSAKITPRDVWRLDRALNSFRAFEEASSAYGAWLLEQAGYGTLLFEYSEFFRAELEAISAFHRTGRLPPWKSFLAAWHEDLAKGRRKPRIFVGQPIPLFLPRMIDVQEVKQGRSLERGEVSPE